MTTARLDVEIDARGARTGGQEAENSLNRVGRSARQANTAVSAFNKSLLITTAAAVFVASLSKATHASTLFKDSLAEVSTLLDDIPGELEAISKAAQEQALQFGSLPVEQTKAFYQIISAGANDAAEATETLTAANRLAVGGVTTVTIAADGLTSAWNVYKGEVRSVTELSDALFVGMRAGKTTIGELASDIGKVAPLAQKAGISFDELVASIAALTKGGISTTESITGVRAILATILKPAQEAQKAAIELGVEFNVAALRAKGLAGFLADVERATKGNTEELAKLFGGVEALVPVLALSGSGAKSFTDILDAMLNKAGATEEAFNKMSKSPGFQIKRLLALTAVVAIRVGDVFSSVLAPAAQMIVDNLELITKTAGVAGTTLLVAFGPQVIALIGTQLVGALALATAGVHTLTAAIAANPIGAIAVAITAATSALIFFGDKIKLTKDGTITLRDVFVTTWNVITASFSNAVKFWVDLWLSASRSIERVLFGNVRTVEITMNDIVESIKGGINAIIGLFVFAVESIGANWGLLPDLLSSATIKSVNLMSTLLEVGINKLVEFAHSALAAISTQAIQIVNAAIELFNKIPILDPVDLLIVPKFDDSEFSLSLGQIEDQAEGTATKIGDNLKQTLDKAFSTDYLGNFVNDFKKAVAETARIRREAEKQPALQAPGLATPTTPQLTESPITPNFTSAYNLQLAEMVKSSKTASAQMGKAFAETFGPGGTLQKGFSDSLAQSIVFGDNLQDSLVNLGKQITAQLISKFIQTRIAMLSAGAAAETMSATTTGAIVAGNTASTASGIANQQALTANAVASNQAITASAAPAAATTSIATSGGSSIAGAAAFTAAMVAMLALVARANGLIEFAKGGMFTNQVVSTPTAFPLGVMGEAGPEAIMPLQRDSSGRLGVIAVTPPGSQSTVFAPVVRVNIENVSGDTEGRQIGGEVARQVKTQLDLAFANYIRREQRPGGQLNRRQRF